ncbi:hypothetical protein H9L39_10236 [Fusarium oxysporum f. sp. albedinis]|nr:hypothetical protein H9L39_10236 [Fusarium oxysporum f. sp. albedinis]
MTIDRCRFREVEVVTGNLADYDKKSRLGFTEQRPECTHVTWASPILCMRTYLREDGNRSDAVDKNIRT